ncbi:MAG: CGNR zinc finger domain-containing protein [Acidobacteriota bacterium]
MAKKSSFDIPPSPAPGELRLLQDFINTLDLETGEDRLANPQALATWLARRQLGRADGEVDDAVWQSAMTVRQGLRAVIALRCGAEADPSAVESLNQALGSVRLAPRFDQDGGLFLHGQRPGWPGVLARLVLIVSSAVKTGQWRRLKLCRNTSCLRVFYDASRNHSGKWCTTRRCGNRLHSKTYRSRGPTHLRGKPPIMILDHRMNAPVRRPDPTSLRASRQPLPED